MQNRNLYINGSILSYLFDNIVLSILFVIFVDLQYKSLGFYFPISQIITAHYKALLLLILSWYFISKTFKIYKNYSFFSFVTIVRKLIVHFVIFSILVFAISGLKAENLFSNFLGISFSVSLFLIIVLQRLALHFYKKNYFIKNPQQNAILLGNPKQIEGVFNLLNKRPDFGIGVLDQFDFEEDWFNKTLNIIQNRQIEFIYISVKSVENHKQEINQLQEYAENLRIKIYFIPDNLLGDDFYNLSVTYFDTFPMLTYGKFPLDHEENQIGKRVFDLVFTILIFVFLLSWLMPIIALLVLITQGRPIFFSQKRNGLNGKEFDCLKFRTMIPHKHNSVKPTERNDPRVTRLGRILRKTSLDELPQFINVLKGEMSIVGPRPHMVSENESYSDIIKRYSLRHYVKPGITGLAQTKGYRGAIDSDIDMEKRIRADIYYVRNWSFLLDIFIIYKTVKLMIFGDENAI